MGKESILIGIVGIIVGIFIFIKTGALVPSSIVIILGILIIALYKEEDKIERRKDKNEK